MRRQELIGQIRRKRSYLCVGLDTDLERIPASLIEQHEDPVFAFNKRIIDATIDVAVAYKPNLAFYESNGSKGWASLEKTMAYLHKHPSGPVFTIADAKRGDIGNSAMHYARAFFDKLGFDAVTVNPYMGHDAVAPFLKTDGRWAIILALTSNPGSLDFQTLQPQLPMLLEKLGIKTSYFNRLFELVIEQSTQWGNEANMMFVVGATQAEMLARVRDQVPDHFLLVPGVGAQGGSLENISSLLLNKDIGMLVNSSRGILYASSSDDFDSSAHHVAQDYQKRMEALLREKSLL
jgi:orotidine-5'-phosphate decarboxylase